ncbi:ribosomal protein L22e, partial [Mycena alexandri]
DGIFDGTDFEKFLHDRIKVEGNKVGQLGKSVKILTFTCPAQTPPQKLTVTTSIHFSKRYLKYLTKKFLKRHAIRDWVHVVAPSKDIYQLRYNTV